jgi:nucleotide-binding universal stress UspA family protein
MKILLAIDGSKFSDAAVKTLAAQFRAQGTEALVLRVAEPPVFSTPPQMARGYAPELSERMKEELAQANETVARAAETLRGAGFKVESRVIEGEVRSGILGAAEQWGASLIVLGSHGARGLQKFLLGSVAESVARHARCSVLIVRIPLVH